MASKTPAHSPTVKNGKSLPVASPTGSSSGQGAAAAAAGGKKGGGGANGTYSGDFWNLFFNGKTAIAEAFRRDPKLAADTPAWVLGRNNQDGDPDHVTQWVNMNVKHIHYFSYRNRFPEPLDGGLDHDAGWGCMIRTGQMMLCEALKQCHPSETIAKHAHFLFRDLKAAPFGIHQMVEEGAKAHIPVGQWFSPTALAFTVKRLIAKCDVTSADVAVVIGMDGAVRRDEISAEFVEGKPVIVMVPVMAGRERIPADAQRAILKMFELPCTLGIVGGRPKHSLYFVGAQRDQVFFLDPHTVQPAFVSKDTTGAASGVRGTMAISDVDPSMVLCFLLKSNRDLEAWERAFAEVINPLTEYPLFSVVRSKKSRASPARQQQQQHAAASPTAATAATVSSSPSASMLSASLSSPAAGGSPAGPTGQKAVPDASSAAPEANDLSQQEQDSPDDFDDCAYDSDVEQEMGERQTTQQPPSDAAATTTA